MGVCIFCNKGLKKYAKWYDWKNRISHYKCWKLNEERIYVEESIDYRLWETNLVEVL